MKVYVIVSREYGVIKATTDKKLAKKLVKEQTTREEFEGVFAPSVYIKETELIEK